jgi:ElaB/YqjD/DUF883 family membrane-anchored ribosome-binding protein
MAKRILKAVKKSEMVEQAAEAVNDAVPAGSSVEQRLTGYAESIGTAMGNVRGHIDGWTKQRAHLIDQLSTLVADAQHLLADLGHATTERVSRLRGRKKTFKQPASNPAGALKPIKAKAQKTTRGVAVAADKPRRPQQINRKVPT